MKLTKISNLMMLGLVLTFAAAGCKKGPTPLTKLPNGRTSPDSNPNGNLMDSGNPVKPFDNPNGMTPTGIPQNADNSHMGWKEDPDALKPETVYFDFDKSAIKASEESKLGDVASYLKSNAGKAVRVEGNCDERGTEEYNRSLGERRALAAREYLVGLGIEAGRVDIVTYGEDKPAVPGHGEEAWSKNRRDDFVVLSAP
jgi:peptidoglycan-associated lipoprotein